MEILKDPPYGNIKVFNLEGELIFRCGPDRAAWYLSRGLAKELDSPEEMRHIQLIFKTAGPGRKDDEYFLSDKFNGCVVCGKESDLTRHHVVPKEFRKFFPKIHKTLCFRNQYDVMVICWGCHRKYEKAAFQLKLSYAQKYGIPIRGIGQGRNYQLTRVACCANTLLYHYFDMHTNRLKKLLKVVQDYCGEGELTILKLAELSNLDTRNTNFVHYGKIVVEKEPDIQAFCCVWRHHFLDVMQPKYIHPSWDPDRRF